MGAPQSRLYETAVGLRERGWEVLIITAMPNYPTGRIFNGYRRKLYCTDEINGLVIHRFPLLASNSRKSFPRIVSMVSFSISSLFSVIKLWQFKPQYVLTESPPLTLAVTGIILSKFTGAKHIMNVSDIWPLSAMELHAISEGTSYNFLRRLEKRSYRMSYACTGQSEEIVNYLRQEGSSRTLLYRNGVDIERFAPAPERVEQAGRRLKIVYTGLLGVAQGIFAICRNIDFANLGSEFHIYGDGGERNDIESFLANHPDKGIYLHAAVGRELIPSILNNYHVTLIPLKKSIYGAVPSKIYESMAAGLPILFAGGGEGAMLVRKYQVGWLCQPSDYKRMQELIKEISTLDASVLDTMRVNCIKAARDEFDRKVQIDRLNTFLSEK
jgi:glycosyltransferase involved in cell wall biosynthesis